MKKFIEKIEKICKENEKVAMFIDMDGTITVYDIYPENMVNEKMQEEYSQAEPAQYIIDILEKVNHIPNLDLYILSLSRTVKITKEKKKWLKKYIPFIEEANWIIITKELNEYRAKKFYGNPFFVATAETDFTLWLKKESWGFSEGVGHYLIITLNDIVDIASVFPPQEIIINKKKQ